MSTSVSRDFWLELLVFYDTNKYNVGYTPRTRLSPVAAVMGVTWAEQMAEFVRGRHFPTPLPEDMPLRARLSVVIYEPAQPLEAKGAYIDKPLAATGLYVERASIDQLAAWVSEQGPFVTETLQDACE